MKIRLSFQEWLLRTEELISSALSNIREQHWEEDYASVRWMDSLRDSLPCVEITDLGRPYAMEWDALKLDRAQETPYGDIGVFVRIDYPNGARVEGVGFIEAKRFYLEHGNYHQLKEKQLRRMVANVEHHRLGLYERTPIPEAVYGLSGHGIDWVYNRQTKLVHPGWRSVLAAVVPSTVALELRGNRPTDLHPACLPLSYQLCARYLGGYDLDTDPDIVKEVRTGGAGAPTFLFISNVVIGGETTPTTEDRLGLMTPGGPYSALEPDHVKPIETELVATSSEKTLGTVTAEQSRARQRKPATAPATRTLRMKL